MADLAYLVDADERLSRPELDLAAAAAAAATHQDDAKSVDMRVSMPESLVIPRDLSMYGPPPPVPRKDTRPNTRIYTADEIRAMQKAELAATVQRQQENKKKDDEHETPVAARREIPSVAESWDIKIAMPAAVVPAQHATDLRSMPAKAQPSTVTMQAFNPLLMSPPSPAPDAAPRPRSETPSRPARPTSLRLPSEPPPEDKILNKVFKVERPFITVEPRPYTADSRSTRAQTVYTSTTIKTAASSRVVKYGRGKNATTELIPQPTDEPNDPLVSWRRMLLRDATANNMDNTELATLEKRTQLLRASHHRGLVQCNEDGAVQRQLCPVAAIWPVLRCCRCVDWRAFDTVGGNGPGELHCT